MTEETPEYYAELSYITDLLVEIRGLLKQLVEQQDLKEKEKV